MPVYSYLHQLLNVNTCHAYIHTRRCFRAVDLLSSHRTIPL
jgi:hypothetical protein